jgi:adenylate cyclase
MSEARKLAAILVADVVGYSRLAGADEERTLSRLRGLRSDLIDPAIGANHGRIVKRTGDGSIVEFRSAVDAVRCAIEMQQGLIERNTGVPEDRRIEFRIGIHVGDVVEESDGDLMGDGVNVASRLEGIARPGAICLSEQAYWQVKGRLDLKVSDLGAIRLKNIAEPIRAYLHEVGAPARDDHGLVAKLREKTTDPKNRSRPAILGAAVAALAILAAVCAWYFLAVSRTAPVASKAPVEPPRLSIVALPFANLSSDPAQDYLGDALTGQLTTALARNTGAFVIARNTAFTYKGKPVDAKAIGKDLGVRYVLEGSVLPTGNQVRVNAQLIDADSGAHVWADQFDTPRVDLLQTQDEIVTRLARALDLQFRQVEAARLKRTPPANPDAEDLMLQCASAVIKGGVHGKEAEAGFPLCEKALALDPNNVGALALLTIKYRLGIGLPERDLQRADELVSQALALDPNSAFAHQEKAWVLLDQGRADQAMSEAERALSLNPTMADAYANMGWASMTLGHFEKGLQFFDKAIRLSPHDPILYDLYGGKASAYNELKQYDEAIEWARRAIAINPSVWQRGYSALGLAYLYTGRFEKSVESCDQLIRLSLRDPDCYRIKAGAYFAMMQYDQAIEWSRRLIAIASNDSLAHGNIIAALALTSHEADAHEALLRFLALPPDPFGLRTIAAWKAYQDRRASPHTDPAVVDFLNRRIEGLRKAGMPEQ